MPETDSEAELQAALVAIAHAPFPAREERIMVDRVGVPSRVNAGREESVEPPPEGWLRYSIDCTDYGPFGEGPALEIVYDFEG